MPEKDAVPQTVSELAAAMAHAVKELRLPRDTRDVHIHFHIAYATGGGATVRVGFDEKVAK